MSDVNFNPNSTTTVLPKEQLSAYQRWEMASFGDNRPSVMATAVVNPTAESVAKIREDAQQEGYAAGVAQGIAAGRAEATVEIAQLRQIAEAFSTAAVQANEVIAQDMLDLTLDLAKAMLKTALAVHPEIVIPIVKEAISYLPTLQQPAHLFLHPADLLLVKNHMGDQLENAGWQTLGDAQVERGGCRVETASNQIDASLPTRWQRLATVLGKDLSWLTQ